MSCDCTQIQKNIPFIGGCWKHEERKIALAVLTFFAIIIPIGLYYGGIAGEEFADSKRQIATMGCLDLRHFLATDPSYGETKFAETNFKWKCLEAGRIDLTIDEES